MTTRILIVDDEPVVRALLVSLLNREGSVAREVATAHEATKLCETETFDVFLIDTGLGDGTYLQLIRDLHEADQSREVLVMSTSPSIHSAMAAAKAGASDYLVKPFDDIRQVAIRVERASKQVGLKRERKRLRQALEESEERYRQLFESSPDAVIVYESDTRIIKDANGAALALYERDESSLIGESVDSLRQPNLQTDPGNMSPGIRLRRDVAASGELVDVEVSTAYFSVDGDPMVIEVARDIRERLSAERAREQLQEQLQHSQKMEALGKLAGGIAHDFNNLLAVILNYAGFVEDALHGGEQSEPAQTLEDIELVLQAATSATQVTRQLLSFSRREVLSPEVLSVNDVVVAVENLLRRTLNENVRLETSLTDDLGAVEIDRAQLEQVLINLAVNAQDAMPSGGRIRVVTQQARSAPSDSGAGSSAREWIVVSVEDTGTGIQPDLQQTIFEPFFTTKGREKGTGLGLATVKAIIERARGFVRLESQAGEGTRFHVHLPVSDKAQASLSSQRPRTLVTAARGERILVVDDDDALRRAACRMLLKAGYEPLEARSGTEALETWHKTRDVALLLTDMVMPSMTGTELTKRLLAKQPNLRVVYMTGYAVTDTPGGAAGVGHRILPKPFRERRLLKIVHDALHDAASRSSAQASLA